MSPALEVDPLRRRGPEPVLIVLAAFNGAEYLPAQLESIQSQSRTDWTLLVRDDGSSDATPQILRSAAGLDSRIELLVDDRGHLGPAGNFAELLLEAHRRGSRYVMLADQDDVWLSDKIALSMAAMRELEAQYSAGSPALVYSDACVVGPKLEPRASRLHGDHGGKEGLRLERLLTRNAVTGCTVTMNHSLLRSVLPIPAHAVMHDHWIALCACMIGRSHYIPRATLYYRRHPATVTRTSESRFREVDILRRLASGYYLSTSDMARFHRQVEQFCSLYDRYRDHPSANIDKMRFLQRYIEAMGSADGTRVRKLRSLGIPDEPPARRLLFFARLALSDREQMGIGHLSAGQRFLPNVAARRPRTG